MPISQQSKILEHLNCRMRAILCDSTTYIGKMVAFDKHMNLLFTDCTEYRRYKPKYKKCVEEKRTLGFVLLHGGNIVSLVVEPPDSGSRSSCPSRAESDAIKQDGLWPKKSE